MTFFLAVKVNDLFLLGIWHYLRDGFSLKTLIGGSNLGLTIIVLKLLLLVSTAMPNGQDMSSRVRAFGFNQACFDSFQHVIKLYEGLVISFFHIIVPDDLMIRTRN